MTPADWAAVATGVITVIAGGVGAIRWLVKHYLAELKPNHGSSLHDRLSRVEQQVDRIYDMLIGKNL